MSKFSKFLLFIFIEFLPFFLFSLEYEIQLDPYYSDFGIYEELRGEIPHLGKKSETEIYSYLLKNLYKPKTLVFEISFNPMPYLGTCIKRSYYDFYSKAKITENFNLINALTTGFEEPWAFSIFLGNVVEFDSIKKSILASVKDTPVFCLILGIIT
ncbi:MAG: hypothetical protein K6357_07130 [Elusimicrobiota bacterium]